MPPIKEVWSNNLEYEMRVIRELVEKYPVIAMDTEFPGVVARPIGSFKTSSDYHYQTMRCNVDLLKPVQVGLTLADEDGNYPQDISTWEFNFHFSIHHDMYAPESIELLQKSGIDFQRHEEMGIMPNDFAELMITSGLVLSDDTKWVSFHSGYDFGYLIKLLSALSLPTSEDDFFDVLQTWFPTAYDIKTMIRKNKQFKGGLQDVADDLGVMRIGLPHQAGSDSLLTASTFFKVREVVLKDEINHEEFNGKLYGLGETFTQTNGLPDPGRGGATAAEREDRGVVRDIQTQNGAGGMQAQALGMQNSALSAMATMPPGGTYGPLGTNGAFLRNAMGVGGGR